MKMLLVAATEPEIGPFIQYLGQSWTTPSPLVYKSGNNEIHICITGVGVIATTYALSDCLNNNIFDFILQAGIAGSYDREIDLAQVVIVQSEQTDMGAEDHNTFIDIFDLGLEDPNAFPYTDGKLDCPLHNIPFAYRNLTVSGLTVNTVTGTEETCRARVDLFNCQVESMEGAPFHYVCLKRQLPFAQLRSISNYVEARDKSKWKMKEAIASLNESLVQIIKQL